MKKTHKLIENGVVSGYKKIEDGVVSGYKKVEDKFVDHLFKKDEETTEEAKSRLKNLPKAPKNREAKVMLLAATIMGSFATQEISAQTTISNNNQKEEVKMTKKIIKTHKLIENGVVSGYKLIENGVVSGYKKIEDGVVSGYKKVEDKLVDNLFKKDDETTEEAKSRLKNLSNTENKETK